MFSHLEKNMKRKPAEFAANCNKQISKVQVFNQYVCFRCLCSDLCLQELNASVPELANAPNKILDIYFTDENLGLMFSKISQCFAVQPSRRNLILTCGSLCSEQSLCKSSSDWFTLFSSCRAHSSASTPLPHSSLSGFCKERSRSGQQ